MSNHFSVASYQRMIQAGILTPEDKVELLENSIVLKMPETPLHGGTIDIVKAALSNRVPAGWLLRIQQTVVFSDSQPEPDFAVVRGGPRTYLARHPGPAELGVILEIADSSLLRDQRIYARSGIVTYWIVNLVDRRIEVYSQPSGPVAVPAYGSFQTFQPGDDVPLVLDGQTVAAVPANDLLP
jgi:Uma2 family endonuclease